jgi:hypothetical protein
MATQFRIRGWVGIGVKGRAGPARTGTQALGWYENASAGIRTAAESGFQGWAVRMDAGGSKEPSNYCEGLAWTRPRM